MIKGKSIILMTTNGSMAIVKGKHAKNLVVAGFINLGLAVKFLMTLQEDIVIVCSGKENTFCIEDAVCAGRIVNDLTEAMNGGSSSMTPETLRPCSTRAQGRTSSAS
jgi:2-phosphosulfolactate phosphatase